MADHENRQSRTFDRMRLTEREEILSLHLEFIQRDTNLVVGAVVSRDNALMPTVAALPVWDADSSDGATCRITVEPRMSEWGDVYAELIAIERES
jgi:hypothetical protein